MQREKDWFVRALSSNKIAQPTLKASKLLALRYFVCHLCSPLIFYNSLHHSQRITQTERDWGEPERRQGLISSAKPVKCCLQACISLVHVNNFGNFWCLSPVNLRHVLHDNAAVPNCLKILKGKINVVSRRISQPLQIGNCTFFFFPPPFSSSS